MTHDFVKSYKMVMKGSWHMFSWKWLQKGLKSSLGDKFYEQGIAPFGHVMCLNLH